MSDVDLSVISDGDEVRLRDALGNVLTADAHIDYLRQELYVLAFGTRLYFARKTRAGWQRMAAITCIAHQPSLFA